ncbi:hypothetical protein MHU86_16483 [Fragilaria crotonensis]|nr:hypothetical protein MHU86_16483 [Fragilaria crotonensis]
MQSMIFSETDAGLWWITMQEGREAWKHDIIHDPLPGAAIKLANRTKVQLARTLNDEAGIAVDPLWPMDELKEIANTHRISLQYAKARITEGWSMKPKDSYKFCGSEDGSILILDLSSLRALLGQCSDFKEEDTALQFLGKQLGLRVLFTPKLHCEFAGEGIEYNWVHAKAKCESPPFAKERASKFHRSCDKVFMS